MEVVILLSGGDSKVHMFREVCAVYVLNSFCGFMCPSFFWNNL